MKAVWGGILLGAALTWAAQPSLAQEREKTKATELAKASQEALTQPPD
jgi:hypothetical protein